MAELRNELSWSRTRDGSFETCPRRYWFDYYGSWGGWNESSERRTREIYVLKKLSTRWMWIGSAVHEAIENVLRSLQRGERQEVGPVAEATVERMRADFRDSRAGKHRERPGRHVGLFEHEYGIEVSQQRWKEGADHARACIARFFESPYAETFAGLPAESWLQVEKLDGFDQDGVHVHVKIDAVFRRPDGRVEIVDWKTGRRDRGGEGGNRVQLACYALHALEKGWVDRPEDIVTVEYALATGTPYLREVDPAAITQVREYIRTSIGGMKALLDDVERNLATEARFEPKPSPANCRWCNFRRVCPSAAPDRAH
ncbi:MAG: RecB family exonuclease [Alphaproteobacteria bacterium]